MAPPAFRSFTPAQAASAAAAALARARGRRVRLGVVEALSDETRRNIVLRGLAEPEAGPACPVIVKASRAAAYDAEAPDAFEASGLIREWAAGALLGQCAAGQRFAPALLAADLEQGVLVFDDAGAGLPPLVPALLGGSAAAAERMLTAYAEALAALHVATAGCRARHGAVLRGSLPNAAYPRQSGDWIERVARVPHRLLGGAFPDAEIRMVHDRMRQPGPWDVLAHNDPCPDNVLLAEDGRAILLDFEFARPGHALFDAAYWRMGFPTCWCAGVVPLAVAERISRAYRAAVAPAVPEAADDALFRRESALVDAGWMLGNLAWLLEAALADDARWGRARNRSRILTYLERACWAIGEADMLPGLHGLATAWLARLRCLWPDAAPLEDFPAFAG